MSPSRSVVPHAITREDAGVRIAWTSEGHEALYAARELRLACRCAACVEEMTGQSILDPASVPEGVHPVSLSLVGAYGLRIQWSDGHATGIYTFEQLRQQCPCDDCAEPRA